MNDILNKPKILNFRPVLFSAIMLSAGILSIYFYFLYSIIFYILITLLFVSSLIIICVYVSHKRYYNHKKISAVLLILILIFIFGQVYASIIFNNYNNANIEEKQYIVTCRIDDIKRYDDYDKLFVSDCKLKYYNESIDSYYKMQVYVDYSDNLDIGDTITFTAYVTNNPLKYENSLAIDSVCHKIKYSATSNSITKIGNNKNLFEYVRVFIRDTLKSGMSEESFGISYAMLIGDTSYVEEDTLSSFRNIGIAHLFAVSGLHIGFLSTIIFFVLSKIPINKFIKYLVMIATIFFYSGVCGFSPSSVRAVIMCAILHFAYISGNKYDSLSSISLALIIVLLLNPIQLLSIGLRCSFACVFAISLLNRPLKEKLYKLPDKLASSLAVSISACLGTLPIMIDVFGRFSFISIIVNVLLIPIISVIFIAIFALVFTTFYIPKITLFIPDKILWVISKIIKYFDIQFLIVSGFIIGFFAVTYYAIIVFRSGIINVKLKTNNIICIVLAICTTIGILTDNLILNYSFKTYICSSSGAYSLLSKGGTNILIVNKSPDDEDVYKLRNLLSDYGKNNIDYFIATKSVENTVALVNKCTGYAKINNVIMFANIDTKTISKFTEINYIGVFDDRLIDVKIGKLQYYYNGNSIAFKSSKINMLFSNEMPTNFNYNNFADGYFDYIVTGESENKYLPYFSKDRLFSYWNSSIVKNCVSNGKLKFILLFDKLFNNYC